MQYFFSQLGIIIPQSGKIFPSCGKKFPDYGKNSCLSCGIKQSSTLSLVAYTGFKFAYTVQVADNQW